MQPLLEKIHRAPNLSFTFKEDIIPSISIPWHYHPEYEITLFTEGSGRRYVGNHIERFDGLELIMLGKNLPHCWRNDAEYFKQDKSLRNRALVLHFKEDAFGKDFFHLPEMKQIISLMEEAQRGIKFTGDTLKKGSFIMEKICLNNGFERMMFLFELLSFLSKSKDKVVLASMGYQNRMTQSKMDIIERVYNYALQNYLHEININQIADEVNMSLSAFCRFFKKHTGKTFSKFVNEMRVGYACKLLIETNYPVQRICFESGFNNPSYFFRTFQKITGQRPLLYRREYQVNNINS